MGAGIVEVFAKGGHDVVGIAESDAAVAQGQANLAKSLARAVNRGKLEQSAADAVTARVRWGTDFALLAECELVVEAAPEIMSLKRTIFEQLDRHVQPAGILATNTSSLSVADIAAATSRPSQVVGMHFFNPAPVQRFVEVIRTSATAPGVVDTVRNLATALGKHAAVVGDEPGFIVNRLLLVYINHAIWLHDLGHATVSQLDVAMREHAKYPMGPIELADLIGLDTCLEVQRTIFAHTGREVDRPAASLEQHVAAGRLGRKSGAGYYDYATGPALPVSTDAALEAQLSEDLLVAYFGDAIAMHERGYAAKADIDAGMRLGCGLPFGPWEEIERRGLDVVRAAQRELASRTGINDFLP